LRNRCSAVKRLMTVIVVLEGLGLLCQCLCVDLWGEAWFTFTGTKT